MRKTFALLAAVAAFAPAFTQAKDMTHAMGGNIMIHDGYARAATPNARSGAAFMVLMNHSDTDDRLIAATTESAQRVELHTHIQEDTGVMKMRQVEGGFVLPAGETITLARGGNHVMMMGLTESFDQGKDIALTLTFEIAGDVEVIVPVDNERKAAHDGMDHGSMDHSEMAHDKMHHSDGSGDHANH